jgi:hypothetical protein
MFRKCLVDLSNTRLSNLVRHAFPALLEFAEVLWKEGVSWMSHATVVAFRVSIAQVSCCLKERFREGDMDGRPRSFCLWRADCCHNPHRW